MLPWSQNNSPDGEGAPRIRRPTIPHVAFQTWPTLPRRARRWAPGGVHDSPTGVKNRENCNQTGSCEEQQWPHDHRVLPEPCLVLPSGWMGDRGTQPVTVSTQATGQGPVCPGLLCPEGEHRVAYDHPPHHRSLSTSAGTGWAPSARLSTTLISEGLANQVLQKQKGPLGGPGTDMRSRHQGMGEPLHWQ